jgi:hypothetical protein
MTAEEYERVTGCRPENDDLVMANCKEAGKPGHTGCGICFCGRPKNVCFGQDIGVNRAALIDAVDYLEAHWDKTKLHDKVVIAQIYERLHRLTTNVRLT